MDLILVLHILSEKDFEGSLSLILAETQWCLKQTRAFGKLDPLASLLSQLSNTTAPVLCCWDFYKTAHTSNHDQSTQRLGKTGK